MGIKANFIIMIGLKKNYDFIKCYKSKIDPKYIQDLELGRIDSYKNIVFKDYLPNCLTVLSDDMSFNYSCIGLLLARPVGYLDEIDQLSLDVNAFNLYKKRVITELEALKIEFSFDDVKLHSFVYFS